MNLPKMILFDYGHTLLYEPGWDSLNGETALYKHIKANPNHLTVEEINRQAQELFKQFDAARKLGYEIHERQFQKTLYEHLGVTFEISLEEAEEIFWYGTSPGAMMPDADKMIEYINQNGIHSGVISNIGFSEAALTSRINHFLPMNQFEFFIASSEYGLRKPNRMLFEIALRKAGLDAKDVWFCGDNPQADIEGAAEAGIFPVWYDSVIDCEYRDKSKETAPQCEYLYIREWRELIETLEKLK
ncbi:MAG TPA: HAD family hydrolase [Oscillospiraceae bacterium]|nr:HAD family hydrolase [Oscillospiraceae bacterium]HPF57114.1 HAD family hydrolase [Clostridiales bacterium]HPK36554.1 HAD family hydrolase [Oscillospiraceae bacterium]HPR76636.1 HAD family hydrolase [Oscillospiraceae bacterium]